MLLRELDFKDARHVLKVACLDPSRERKLAEWAVLDPVANMLAEPFSCYRTFDLVAGYVSFLQEDFHERRQRMRPFCTMDKFWEQVTITLTERYGYETRFENGRSVVGYLADVCATNGNVEPLEKYVRFLDEKYGIEPEDLFRF